MHFCSAARLRDVFWLNMCVFPMPTHRVFDVRLSQFCSRHPTFNPICPHVTKDDCSKARRGHSGGTGPVQGAICDRVHFRPLIRPHTDPSLGHCSYLNTCYSEPTYAQSPSLPPFPSGSAARVSLPSGLGAGGRGKEKAPCRYLHFEVDWDEKDGRHEGKSVQKVRKPFKLEIGMGPCGKDVPVVRKDSLMTSSSHTHNSCPLSGLTVTYDILTTLFLGNFMSSWLTHPGTFI